MIITSQIVLFFSGMAIGFALGVRFALRMRLPGIEKKLETPK